MYGVFDCNNRHSLINPNPIFCKHRFLSFFFQSKVNKMFPSFVNRLHHFFSDNCELILYPFFWSCKGNIFFQRKPSNKKSFYFVLTANFRILRINVDTLCATPSFFYPFFFFKIKFLNDKQRIEQGRSNARRVKWLRSLLLTFLTIKW